MVKTIDIRGFPHAYELTAPTPAGDVLIFIHGWLLSREYWKPVIQQLAPTYQCLSYDLRGFGHSQPPPFNVDRSTLRQRSPELLTAGSSKFSKTAIAAADLSADLVPAYSGALPHLGYTPAAYAEDLNLLLEKLNISRAWLIGHSLGGSIALWAADQSPHIIKGVVCVNSGGGIYLKEEFERFRSAGQQLLKFRPRWLRYLPLLELPMSRMNVACPIARTWARQRIIDLVVAHPEAARGALLDSTTETEVHHLPRVVARLQQPVYFLAGANDTIMEPKYVQHLASFHPLFECCGNNVTEIPDCGHLAMIEQPDATVSHIRKILATYSS